jgi:hypothetical protein
MTRPAWIDRAFGPRTRFKPETPGVARGWYATHLWRYNLQSQPVFMRKL